MFSQIPRRALSDLYLLGVLSACEALGMLLGIEALVRALLAAIDGHDVSVWVLLGSAAAAARAFLFWWVRVKAKRLALGVKERLRAELVHHWVRRGGASQDSSTLATQGLDALDAYYTQFLPALLIAVTVPLLVGVRILWADWLSALIVVLTVPLIPLFMALIGWATEARTRAVMDALLRLSQQLAELGRGLPVLVGLGQGRGRREVIERLGERYRQSTMKTLRTAFLSAFALELIATLSVALVAVTIGLRLAAGALGLETGLLVLLLVADCYIPWRQLGVAFHASEDGRQAFHKVEEITHPPNTTLGLGTPHQAVGSQLGNITECADRTSQALGRDLVVQNFSVRYPGREDSAVGPLTFHVPFGTLCLVTGPSGSGKSTLLATLAGVAGRATGQMPRVQGSIAGRDLEHLAWVPQFPHTTEATVADEMRLWGNAEPEAALRRLGLEETVGQHPAVLSLGQLRRLALARILGRIESDDAMWLFADEPTAHVDALSAQVICEQIEAFSTRRGVVVASHDRRFLACAELQVSLDGAPVARSAHSGIPDMAGHTERNERDRLSAIQASALSGEVQGLPQLTAEVQPPLLTTALPLADLPHDRVHEDVATPTAFEAAEKGPSRLMARSWKRGLSLDWLFPWGKLWGGLTRDTWVAIVGAVVFGICASLAALALSALSGWLIVRASQQPPLLYLMVAIVGVRFFGLARATARYLERLCTHSAAFHFSDRLRARLWDALAKSVPARRELQRGDTLLGVLINDMDTLRDILPRALVPVLIAVPCVGAIVVCSALLAPATLGLVVLMLLLMTVLSPLWSWWTTRQTLVLERQKRTELVQHLSVLLDAAPELWANRVETPLLTRIAQEDRAATAAAQRAALGEGAAQALNLLGSTLGALGLVAVLAPQVASRNVPSEIMVALVMLALNTHDVFLNLVSAASQLPVLRRLLLHARAELDVPELPSVPAAPPGKILEVQDLSLGWQARRISLPLSAYLAPGEWLSVTGPSGSGKTTFLATIMGFAAPWSGSLGVSGRVAWCPQESHVFDSTLRGNLALARRTASEEAMDAVLQRVGLGEWLRQLPQGLDTSVGPLGMGLSGGQRQRLAVARAVLAEADLVLLDEPTAHLGRDEGARLMSDLRTSLANAAVVLVTHREEDILPSDRRLDLSQDPQEEHVEPGP